MFLCTPSIVWALRLSLFFPWRFFLCFFYIPFYSSYCLSATIISFFFPRCSYFCLHCKWRAGENQIQMSGSDLCIPRNESALPHYFQNRIITFCLPISTFMYLWAIYIFSRSVCRGPIVGIHECRNRGRGRRSFISGKICFEFSLQCAILILHTLDPLVGVSQQHCLRGHQRSLHDQRWLRHRKNWRNCSNYINQNLSCLTQSHNFYITVAKLQLRQLYKPKSCMYYAET